MPDGGGAVVPYPAYEAARALTDGVALSGYPAQRDITLYFQRVGNAAGQRYAGCWHRRERGRRFRLLNRYS